MNDPHLKFITDIYLVHFNQTIYDLSIVVYKIYFYMNIFAKIIRNMSILNTTVGLQYLLFGFFYKFSVATFLN